MKNKVKISKKIKVIFIILLIVASGIIIGYALNKYIVIKDDSIKENNDYEVKITEVYRNNNSELINDEVENIEVESVTTEKIGTLIIPKLDIETQILEGTDMDILAVAVGHFENSSLWDGNVALASHNRGNSVAHYFDRIHELVEGDEIIYKTNMGERRYKVYSTKEIANTDWSVTEQTEENIITMITCITNQPEKRLCVQAKSI